MYLLLYGVNASMDAANDSRLAITTASIAKGDNHHMKYDSNIEGKKVIIMAKIIGKEVIIMKMPPAIRFLLTKHPPVKFNNANATNIDS